MFPRITIITISFNSAATIEDTIRSVTMQDYQNLEYVIIDGGSTDGTLDIIDQYNDSIQVVISEPDKGISDAFNKLLEILRLHTATSRIDRLNFRHVRRGVIIFRQHR